MTTQPPPHQPRQFYSKIHGVTHGNRQKIVRKLKIGEVLRLTPERDNPADPNAILITRKNGQQLGYIGRELAGDMMRKFGRGRQYSCIVSDLTGGTPDYPHHGVNILLTEYEAGPSAPPKPRRPFRRLLIFAIVLIVAMLGTCIGLPLIAGIYHIMTSR